MRRTLVMVAATSLFAMAPAARADGETAPTALQKKMATEHLNKGRALCNRAEFTHDYRLFEEAYLEYMQAWAIYQSNSLLWNLALSELRTKRVVDALAHFKEYDRREHVLSNAKHVDFKALREHLAEANAATVHVTVDADPGERVFVDDKALGAAPLGESIDLLPGRHTFKAGGHVVEATIAAGDSYTAKLRNESANVVPEPPLAAAPIAPPITAPSSSRSELEPTSEPQPPPLREHSARVPVVLTLASFGIASVVGGVVLGASSASAWSDATRVGRCNASACDDVHGRSSDATVAGRWSYVLYGTGAVLLGTAGVLWLKWPNGNASTEIAPTVTPTQARVDVRLVF